MMALWLLALLVPGVVRAATLYEWVDEAGETAATLLEDVRHSPREVIECGIPGIDSLASGDERMSKGRSAVVDKLIV